MATIVHCDLENCNCNKNGICLSIIIELKGDDILDLVNCEMFQWRKALLEGPGDEHEEHY